MINARFWEKARLTVFLWELETFFNFSNYQIETFGRTKPLTITITIIYLHFLLK